MIWLNWALNPGHSACEADVMATTLLNQLTPIASRYVDNEL